MGLKLVVEHPKNELEMGLKMVVNRSEQRLNGFGMVVNWPK